jgi:hypothetical protein
MVIMKHAYVINNRIFNLSEANPLASGEWIPCSDSAQIGDYFDESILTMEEKAEYIQKHIDQVAREKEFGDGYDCASYSSSTNESWQAEALAFIAWRDAVWVYSYTEFAKMENQEREVPTIEDFITELPVMVWPS